MKKLLAALALVTLAVVVTWGLRGGDNAAALPPLASSSAANHSSSDPAVASRSKRPAESGARGNGVSAQLVPANGGAAEPSITSRAPRRLAHALVENSLLLPGDSGLRVNEVDRLLMSDQFADAIDRMRREGDPDSAELARIYAKDFSDGLASDKRFKVGDVSCGLRVCAAIITSNMLDKDLFIQLLLRDHAGPKLYSVMMQALPQSNRDGIIEYRMVFTIDQRLNRMQVPAA